jgi:hypothetical protein
LDACCFVLTTFGCPSVLTDIIEHKAAKEYVAKPIPSSVVIPLRLGDAIEWKSGNEQTVDMFLSDEQTHWQVPNLNV